MEEVLLMCGKSLGLYFLILICLRFLGKKGMSGASLSDMVIVVLIGTPLGPNLPENNKFAAAIGAVITITLTNYLIDWMIFKNDKVRQFFEGKPCELIKNGKYITRSLVKERIPKSTIEKSIRQYGLTSVEDVQSATLETDGQISIIAKE